MEQSREAAKKKILLDTETAPVQKKEVSRPVKEKKKKQEEYNDIKIAVYLPVSVVRDLKKIAEINNASALNPVKWSDFGRAIFLEYIEKHRHLLK